MPPIRVANIPEQADKAVAWYCNPEGTPTVFKDMYTASIAKWRADDDPTPIHPKFGPAQEFISW